MSKKAPEDDVEQTTGAVTEALLDQQLGVPTVRRFQLAVVEGPQSGKSWESAADRASIGSHSSNDLVIDDPTVSRFHCEVFIDARGTHARDLESMNGTFLDGTPVVEGFCRGGSLLRLGRSVVRFTFSTERNRLPISERTRFGSLVGQSVSMRTTFALLERAAASEATVLLEGETGTGKEGCAEGIVKESARHDKPFVVVDCSAIPENLLESELFGHEKGAFTGAAGRRIGAFEEASGGTLFLDEVGELPPDLQPKLLRALESRHIRRVGSNAQLPIDVRVVAATNRDLRAEVNAGRFRADLYYRLAVVRIPLPPLRARPDDIRVLVDEILTVLAVPEAAAAMLRTAEFIASLQRAAWPGNVRELRNHIERCLVFQETVPIGAEADVQQAAQGQPSDFIDPSRSYDEIRRRALADFERRYIEALVRHHGGKVAQAAREAGIDKAYIYRLMRKYGIRG